MQTLDHESAQIETLARMLTDKRKKKKSKGDHGEIRHVVALSSGGDDRTRERRKRKHQYDQQQKVDSQAGPPSPAPSPHRQSVSSYTQQQEIMQEVGAYVVESASSKLSPQEYSRVHKTR